MNKLYAVTICLLACGVAKADTFSIKASQDARIQKAHSHENHGGAGLITVKLANGEARGLVQFDLPDRFQRLGFGDRVLLRMYASNKRLKNGTWVLANLMACDAPKWVEGQWRRDKVRIKTTAGQCKQEKCRRKNGGPGCPDAPSAGVTWLCPIDPNVQNPKVNCENPGNWTEKYIRRAPAASGIRSKDVKQGAAVDDSTPTRVLNQPGYFTLDVTDHVRKANQCGDVSPSWIIRRPNNDGIRPRILTKESEDLLDSCGFPESDVAPTLILIEG